MTGPDLSPADFSWARLLFAFSTVIALMAMLGFALKYIGTRGITLPGKGARRMRIIETLPIDTRRRFVIVRCDGREHLLLLGAGNDIVVETNLPTPPTTPTP